MLPISCRNLRFPALKCRNVLGIELNPGAIALLCLAGFLAGGINTVAGGGSNLTLPVLMMLGLPADMANGTNRVGIWLQCLAGVRAFDRHEALPRTAVVPVFVPTLSGGLVGALLAVVLPNLYLKPVLLICILVMAVVMLVKPEVIAPPPGTAARSPAESKLAWWGLFGAGVYGGFVQAGVGFILLAVLTAGLRYDLLRANALKMSCALAFTTVALGVFIVFGKVHWLPGLVLAAGATVGAWLAVRIAVKVSHLTLRRILFVLTLVAVAGGFLA